MPAGIGQILGSRVNPSTGEIYQLDVTNEGAIPISGYVGISGPIIIGSVTANVDSIYVQSGTSFMPSGNVYVQSGANITNINYQASGNVTITDNSYINIAASGNTGMPISGALNVGITTNPLPVSGTVYTGSSINVESLPIDSNMNNPKWSLEYDTDGNVGSVYQIIGTGSYVNTITWSGFSGTLPGVGSRVTNVSAWSVV